MELDTIDMNVDNARANLRAYREAFQKTHRREDQEIARGYNELAKGRPLIRLSDAIVKGGLDENHRPRLAVARADQPWCYLTRDREPSGTSMVARFIGCADVRESWRVTAADRVLRFIFGDLEPLAPAADPADWNARWRAAEPWRESRARRSHVPVVPPGLRPRQGGLHLYHVLWEVEEWAPEPAPPRDPALLRHVGGDLWAVYGVWDLSELERAVLAGRL